MRNILGNTIFSCICCASSCCTALAPRSPGPRAPNNILFLNFHGYPRVLLISDRCRMQGFMIFFSFLVELIVVFKVGLLGEPSPETRVNFLHIFQGRKHTTWHAIGGLYRAIRRTYDSLAARRTRRSETGDMKSCPNNECSDRCWHE